MLLGMVVRNFFTSYVLPDLTPTGGKSQNTGVSGHFGLGRPPALREIPGMGRKRGKCNFPVLGALFWGECGRPKIFSLKVANFFNLPVLADRTRRGGKLRGMEFLGHFGVGRLLALREIPGGKQKNANSRIETEKRETSPLQLGPNTQS